MNGRVATLLTTLVAATAVAVTRSARDPFTCYIWNASESVPIGLYRLQPTGKLVVTDLVAVQPPESLATFLASEVICPAACRC